MKKKSNSYFLLGSLLAKHGLKVDNDVKFEEKMILKCPENYKNLEKHPILYPVINIYDKESANSIGWSSII